MKKITALFLALVLLFAAGCGTAAPAETPDVPSQEPEITETEPESTQSEPAEEPEKKKLSILFIGNSATSRNYMSKEIFKKFSKAAGYEVNVTLISEGGYTLEKFADPSDQLS